MTSVLFFPYYYTIHTKIEEVGKLLKKTLLFFRVTEVLHVIVSGYSESLCSQASRKNDLLIKITTGHLYSP